MNKKYVILLTSTMLLVSACGANDTDVNGTGADKTQDVAVVEQNAEKSTEKSSPNGAENSQNSTENNIENNIENSQETSTENATKNTQENTGEQACLSSISYSNLVDDAFKVEVKESMLASGLEEKNIEMFLKAVSYYNTAVGDAGLVKEGFKTSENLQPTYDIEKIIENWDTANSSFEKITGNRNNCRMTTFLLGNNLINIDGEYVNDNKMLFMDNDTIQYSENAFFTEENIAKFNTFYGDVSTDLVKDIDVHLSKIKAYWNEKKVSFADSKASIITVWIHSDLDNNLFVGHTGILFPSNKEDKFLFVEKISFEEPYQVLKFNNRVELNDYLMGKYDNAYGQPTASPLILENDELLKGYRENPNKQ